MAVAALFCMSARAYGFYQPSNLLRPRSEITEGLLIWVLVFLCLATVAFTLKISDVFSRGTVLLFFTAGAVGIIASRVGIARALTSVMSSGALSGRRVALLTDSNQPIQNDLVAAFNRYGYAVSRVFDVAAKDIDDKYSHQTAGRIR